MQNNVYRTIRERTFAGRDPYSTFAGRDHTASDNSNCNYNHATRKNPKRVAAGKLVAERTRLAREQQKKAAAEAAIIAVFVFYNFKKNVNL